MHELSGFCPGFCQPGFCQQNGSGVFQERPITTLNWFVYVLRCRRGRLYTGITTDPVRRLREHARGQGARSLRGQAPLLLVYCLRVPDHSHALRLEYRIKRLTRQDKQRLLSGALVIGHAGGYLLMESNRLSAPGTGQV